jgi:hypothetical protein
MWVRFWARRGCHAHRRRGMIGGWNSTRRFSAGWLDLARCCSCNGYGDESSPVAITAGSSALPVSIGAG